MLSTEDRIKRIEQTVDQLVKSVTAMTTEERFDAATKAGAIWNAKDGKV